MCQNGCKKKCNCKVTTIPKGEKGDSGTTCINITYAALATLKTNSLLVDGAFYKITDRCDLGLVIRALSINELSLDGEGYFLNCDYQNTFGNNLGIWYSGLGGISIGKVVIYSGIQYSSVTGVVGTDPGADAVNWLAITRSINTYVLEIDVIRYNFDADTIFYRADKRRNEVYKDITVFKWGSDINNNIKDFLGTLNIINSKINLLNVINKSASGIVIDETNSGTILNTEFGEMTYIVFTNCTSDINFCYFNSQDSINITGTVSYSREYIINDVASTFPTTLDMSSGAVFSAGVLTVDSSLKYIGIFTLINNSGQTISKIVGLPKHNRVRFYVESGNTQSFQHTAIGAAVINNLVSSAVTLDVVVGRSFGGDFIEYETSIDPNTPSDILNVKYQLVKMV